VTPPIHEKLEGKNVTKYQLTVKKESLRSFLDALEKEASADPELAKSSKGIAEYKKEIEKMLDSPDFNEVYDYTKSNIFLTVWTREDGVPVRMEVRFRVVPSLESKNLADKQIEIVLTMMLNKINETIMIEEPKDAKTYREVVGTSTRGFLW
jgi:hypothetical protein